MTDSYRDLKVWQKAIEMTVALYKLTEKFPKTEIYGLTSQLRRAGVSTASNIAEGSVESRPASTSSFSAWYGDQILKYRLSSLSQANLV
jgi:hypothetical protein